jgi:hypothetical protein
MKGTKPNAVERQSPILTVREVAQYLRVPQTTVSDRDC